MNQNFTLDMSCVDLYIFDFDYTLFDTSKGMSLCYEAAFNTIEQQFIHDNLAIYVKEGLRSTFNRFNTADNSKLSFGDFERTFLKTSEKVMAENSFPYNDTISVISLLKKTNKKLAIVTGKSRERVLEILKKYGIDNCFEKIIGYGDYTNEKPNPESIKKCLESYKNISKEKISYIGDSLNDIKAAQEAEIHPVFLNRENRQISADGKFTEITSLSQLIWDFQVCIFTVMQSGFDLFKAGKAATLIQEWCAANSYEIISESEDQIKIMINAALQCNIMENGILILSKLYRNKVFSDADRIIEWKNHTAEQLMNDKDNYPHSILMNYDEFCMSLDDKRNISMFTSKVSYTLVCYNLNLFIPSALEEEIVKSNILQLLVKHKISNHSNNLEKLFEEYKISHCVLAEGTIFAAAWGARIIIFHNRFDDCFMDEGNRKDKKYLNIYIESEIKTQYTWLLLSNSSRLLDATLEKRNKKNEELSLLNYLYNILFAEANFNYINATTTHRYELEILNILYKVSKLNEISHYFKEKSSLLERKVTIENQKQENRNTNTLNIIMFLLTLVSTVSAIFQIVDYCYNDSHAENMLGLLVTIIVMISSFVIFATLRIIKK